LLDIQFAKLQFYLPFFASSICKFKIDFYVNLIS